MQKETENQTKQFFLKKVKNVKKLTIIFLAAALVLSLAGCKPLPVTPANVTNTDAPSTQSVVTSAQPEESVVSEPQPKEDSVSKEDSKPASKPESSKSEPIESKTSSIPSNSPKPVAFQNWTVQTRSQYVWEINTPYDGERINKLSCIALCNSQEELKSYLSKNGQPQELAEQYPEEYFLQNSLLLFKGYESCRGDLWLVKEMQEEGEVLSVAFEYHPISIIDAIGFSLYHVEVQQKTNHIKSIESTVRYQKRSGNDQNSTPKTETAYWSVP